MSLDFDVNASNDDNDHIANRWEFVMAVLTIRNVDDVTKTALRIQAAQHGVSMEEEARRILRDALARAGTPATPLGQRIRERFAGLGGEDLVLPTRQLPRTPPRWEPSA